MDAQKDDIGDAALLEQVPNLDAGIADGIVIMNLEAGMLGFPGFARIASLDLELGSPIGMLFGFIVLAAIGLIDGVDPLFLPRGFWCTIGR